MEFSGTPTQPKTPESVITLEDPMKWIPDDLKASLEEVGIHQLEKPDNLRSSLIKGYLNGMWERFYKSTTKKFLERDGMSAESRAWLLKQAGVDKGKMEQLKSANDEEFLKLKRKIFSSLWTNLNKKGKGSGLAQVGHFFLGTRNGQHVWQVLRNVDQMLIKSEIRLLGENRERQTTS